MSDAQPLADSAKSKQPKKKVRVDPASSDVTPLATATPMQVDEPAAPPPASGKAPTKPLPVPSSKCAPVPKDAAPVLFCAPSAPCKLQEMPGQTHCTRRFALWYNPHTACWLVCHSGVVLSWGPQWPQSSPLE
ncbi:hypothetical protein AGABI1DRAFT_132078 [Agaricus bisporus var. burnettii JB137-S8]|uniref:Uncharacterized protein n=1 Tax=Agaricus bisporus var. burnettii (strain JB137-S8 / ATCC MYA-4627 / FGSC 10392) TaxID=597362 RepID=K5WK77_AGABU|nr:uncharacterized protein AGABI1DRAFT_132078 [Agaricus bisporus var. burnettii JB137-S8]EKM75686.1 hypothetical protein AGABI1DRAFT_132078 [Agaricus bisporus var. burnettii JB137-S8]